MLKMLNQIFRFFVPTKEQVIAKQNKDRHARPTANLGNDADKALYKDRLTQNRFHRPGL